MKKFSKGLKYIFYSLGLFVLLVCIVIGVALNYVFTPEKITPKVVQVINQNLNADLQVESMEITFFSSFPNFHLNLKNGVILNKISSDSLPLDSPFPQDSLISFDQCFFSINPIAYLRTNRIKVEQVTIDQPYIYAFINEEGVVNWDILKSTEEKEVNRDTVKSATPKFKPDINIKDITITDATLIYDDRSTRLYASTSGFDLSLNAIYNEKTVLLDLETNSENVIFWQEGEALLENVTVGLLANMNLDRISKVLKVKETKLSFNNIEFLVDGQMLRNREKERLEMDLNFKLDVPSLAQFMELIPKSYLQPYQGLTTSGQVTFAANIKGNYGKEERPITNTRLNIQDGGIEYARENAIQVKLQNLNFLAEGQLMPNLREQHLGLDMAIKLDIPPSKEFMVWFPENLWQANEKMATKSQVALTAKVQGNLGKRETPTIDGNLNLKNLALQIQPTGAEKVTIPNINLSAKGQFQPNIAEQSVKMDANLDLKIPALDKVIRLIPVKLFKYHKDFSTKGQLALVATLKGKYDGQLMPTVNAHLNLKKSGLQYRNRPNKIDLIETDLAVFMDISNKIPSTLKVDNLLVKGLGTDLSLSGNVANIFNNPKIDGQSKGVIDFAAVSKILPPKLGIAAQGMADLDLKGTFWMDEILNNDYGKIDAVGKVKLSDIKFQYQKEKLVVETALATAIFGQKQESKILTDKEHKVFGGLVKLTNTKLVKRDSTLSFDKLRVDFVSTPWENRQQIASMQSNLKLENVRVNLADSLKGLIGKVNATINLHPSKKNPKIPTIHTEFRLDSSGVTTNGTFVAMKEGDFNLDLVRKGRKNWQSRGYVTFDSLYAYTPLFPLLLKMPKTKVSVQPGLIELNHAKMLLGNSDLEVTGSIYDFEKTILEKKTLKAELAINSTKIDGNELIKTLNEGVILDEETLNELIAADEKVTAQRDTTSMETFIVPKGINFTFESQFDQVLFGDLVLNKVYGLIEIKDQSLHLVNLRMNTLAADMTASVRYTAKNKADAAMDFDFGLTDIDIEKLVNLMPALDTLIPMVESFEGKVDFKMQGKCELDTKMGVDLPTLQAIARIEGQDMVILDGETFAYLSKLLMFKNKAKNTIDSLSFEMMVQGSVMEVFPSLMTVDRYKIAVGGQHKLDMTYNYHVSVLKSPMPFKAGIDVTGNLEDYDFNITKAKYKYLFSDKKRHQEKADSSILKRKDAILAQLKF